METTVHYSQTHAPTPAAAAQATLEDLAKITVGGSIIIEVDDGEDTFVFSVSSAGCEQILPRP